MTVRGCDVEDCNGGPGISVGTNVKDNVQSHTKDNVQSPGKDQKPQVKTSQKK